MNGEDTSYRVFLFFFKEKGRNWRKVSFVSLSIFFFSLLNFNVVVVVKWRKGVGCYV